MRDDLSQVRQVAHVLAQAFWNGSVLCLGQGTMRLLLTSAGISNTSIHDALVDLLGKPIAESSALFIPTAIWPFPGGTGMAWQAITGKAKSPLAQLGWKSMGLLELTALPSIDKEAWVPMVKEADALLVWGGDVLYLRYWMRQSGLAELFAALQREIVYVGVSAGSMVAPSYLADTYTGYKPLRGSDVKSEEIVLASPQGDLSNWNIAVATGMGLIDSALFPHLDHEMFPENSLANLEKVAGRIPVPMYAIDDQTAIKVTDGAVEVVSEGHWKLFTP
jgi:dipeptidase E